MTARSALRSATADDHRRVDDIFSAFSLSKEAGYRGFLRAIAAAHVPAEAGLDAAGAGAVLTDWEKRRRNRLICDDLETLGHACPDEAPHPSFAGEPELLGGIYVLEGSRLGGALLRRTVPEAMPKNFLSAPNPPGAWRRLGEILDLHLSDRQKLDRAISAARQLFTIFGAAGLSHLESRH